MDERVASSIYASSFTSDGCIHDGHADRFIEDNMATLSAWKDFEAASFWQTCRALATLNFLSPSSRTALIFSLRTLLAGLLALYLSFQLQLDSPLWAPITVWIVAQPGPGMAISKSLYRVVGTVIGVVAGVLLLALFPQSPELFLAALALYVGGCVFMANILRNFRGYAAILAAITAVGVAMAAQPDPDAVFTIAVARVSSTLIGIGCAIFAAVVFTKFEANDHVIATLEKALEQSALRLRRILRGEFVEEDETVEIKLIASLINLDSQIDFAAAESADLRIHAGRARSVIARILGLIASSREVFAIGERIAISKSANAWMTAAVAACGQLQQPGWTGRVDPINAKLALIKQEIEKAGGKAEFDPQIQSYLDRVVECLTELESALADWSKLFGPWTPDPVLHLNFHRDWDLALRHGVRAACAMAFVGWVWVVTSWSSGGGVLIITAIVVSLLSTLPRPDLAGWTFLQGTLGGCLSAFICTFFFLQNVDGNYFLFSLCLGLFLLPATMLTLSPKTVALGLSYCVVFFIVMNPLNPMVYNVSTFLNSALADVFGVLVGVVFYQTLYPPNPLATRGHIRDRLTADLLRLTNANPVPHFCAWQSRTFDRLNRLYGGEPLNPLTASARLEDWAVLSLGNDVLRLRYFLRDKMREGSSRAVIDSLRLVLQQIGDGGSEVEGSIGNALARIDEKNVEDGGGETRRQKGLMGILSEIRQRFIDHPNLLQPRSVHHA